MSDTDPEHTRTPEPAPGERTTARDASDTAGRGETARPRVVVVGPDGVGVASDDHGPGEATVGTDEAGEDAAGTVDQPAKVMRIGTMIKQLLDEVRSAPLDEAARARLAEVHERSLRELEDGLSPELVAELHRITLPFEDDATPSDSELRIAQAQLVGWLEGLFHGIQTALVAQHMASQAQLAQMRRALPPGLTVVPGGPDVPGGPGAGEGAEANDGRPTPGQYL
ncbi:bacterial proteasome activator family protein [Cellulomonas fimi]|uniref:bacterial proteasome activator family protein n=1 Tax=Cellulomonas fimi TaxID=1708 RepID=UPI0024AF9D18|nr:bacterial proteasome activator family protein [Cellulomonas fimi]